MKRLRRVVWLAAVVLLSAGVVNLPAADRPMPTEQSSKPEVTVKIRSWEGFEKLVAAHEGKVVVVDIWTTTCGKCVEEFPQFVKLRKEFPRKKIALMSLNCDYDGIEGKPPEYYRADVLKFLRKHEATFDNVMLDIALLDFLEKIDLSSTPAILVYGPDGKLTRRFDNDEAEKAEDEFTLGEVQELVEKLLPKAD